MAASGVSPYMAGEGDLVLRARATWQRWFWIAVGFALIAVGVVGALIPFTFHLLGGLMVLGVILVLRNSRAWRRRFVRMQRKHPRWLHPVRRVLKGHVLSVLWHEGLRTERFLLPRPWRRLGRWRRTVGRRLRAAGRRARPSAGR